MTTWLMIAADIVAIMALTFGLYFRRHRRKDLLVAFLGVNVGVLAVSIQLGSSSVGLGLGLGLFGVLSIIRLRSAEIAQHEVAYYFAALALGLLAGLSTSLSAVTLGSMALIIAALWFGDHPRVFGSYRNQTIVLDRAYGSEDEAIAAVSILLNAEVRNLVVLRTDLVNDSMVVDVRYRTSRPAIANGRQPERGVAAAADAEELALRRLQANVGTVRS